jgi:hypothetical protein
MESIRTPNTGQADYIGLAETHALLASSLAARQLRIAADDMISINEAAALANTRAVTIDAWIATGRCIGLPQPKHGFGVPRWQFEPQIWPLVPKLSAALGTTEGWALLAFLEMPLGALGGLSPRTAIEQGQGARVVDLARQLGN